MKKIVNLKTKIAEKFSMKNLDPAKKILEMRINREKRLLKISQAEYVEVLKRFNMADAKYVNASLGGHFKLSKANALTAEDEKALMLEVSYASAVENLMYVIICTRPDIAQAVRVVSMYISNSQKKHWRAVKWILRYLKGSSDMALCYDGRRSSAQICRL